MNIVVDGKTFSASDKGQSVLTFLRGNDFEIPTLCSHSRLGSDAACRLCIVEAHGPSLGKADKIVCSCVTPLIDGMVITTDSQRISRSRQITIAFLSMRSPDSIKIRELAEKYGCAQLPLIMDRKDDEDSDEVKGCVLCGLCIRACKSVSANALVFCCRGHERHVAHITYGIDDPCKGCGLCLKVCPTGAIADLMPMDVYEYEK